MGLTPKHAETPDVVAWQRETTNGKHAPALLREIEPPQYDPDLEGPARLYPPAAVAMTDLLAAAKAANHPVKVKYSYRTYAKQEEKWQNYQDGGNLAAPPGTSNHGEGLAVDFTDLSSTDVRWLIQNAWGFRFDNGDIASDREPWHWTYRGGYTPKEERDVTGDDLVKGIEAFNRGEPEPKEGPAAKIYRALTEAASKPKPEVLPPPTAEHYHRVNVTRRKTGSPLV